jgi:hypothetical protein
MKYIFKIAEIATEPEKAIELVNEINTICNSNSKLRNTVYKSNDEFLFVADACLKAIEKHKEINNPNLSIIIEPII